MLWGINEINDYDELYDLHRKGIRTCIRSTHDQKKARRKVRQVFSYFNIRPEPQATALDVGCGLGYFAEALDNAGFSVTGIDNSRVAIECASNSFPHLSFKCASYPGDVDGPFDLIWAVGFPGINTFEIPLISDFVKVSLKKLRPNGVLVLGWHTDFTGRTIGNWSRWDLGTIRTLKKATGLRGPVIVQTRHWILNPLGILMCLLLRKSAPIFLVRRAA